MASPEYAAFFAVKWADILRNKREGTSSIRTGHTASTTGSSGTWPRISHTTNSSASVLAASGTPETDPAGRLVRTLRSPDAFVDDTAQVFLGMRSQCAKCHHHPFEVWSQDDYYGFAAFFAASVASRRWPPSASAKGRGHLQIPALVKSVTRRPAR